MKSINLFNKLLLELTKLFEFLEIGYITDIQAINEGTVIFFYAYYNQYILQRRSVVLFHSQVGELYLESNKKQCSPSLHNFINIYIKYDGTSNFEIMNEYNLANVRNDKITRLIFVYNGEEIDLLYELFTMIQYYPSNGKKFSTIFKDDACTTQDFIRTLREIAISCYYIADSKNFHIKKLLENIQSKSTIFDHRTMMARKNVGKDYFFVKHSVKAEHLPNIDYSSSKECTNSPRNFTTRVYPQSIGEKVEFISPFVNKSREVKEDIRLGCVHGSIKDYLLVSSEGPIITFKNYKKSMLCTNNSAYRKKVFDILENLSVEEQLSLLKQVSSDDKKDISILDSSLNYFRRSKRTKENVSSELTNEIFACINNLPYRNHIFAILKNLKEDELSSFISKLCADNKISNLAVGEFITNKDKFISLATVGNYTKKLLAVNNLKSLSEVKKAAFHKDIKESRMPTVVGVFFVVFIISSIIGIIFRVFSCYSNKSLINKDRLLQPFIVNTSDEIRVESAEKNKVNAV